MPKLNLLDAAAIKVSGGNALALKGAGFSWSAPAPISRATMALSDDIVWSAHSLLITARGPDHGGDLYQYWTGEDRYVFAGFSSLKDRWDAEGIDRTFASTDCMIVTEIADLSTGVYAPDSAAGIESLQYLYWYALNAQNKGCQLFVLYPPWSTQAMDETYDNDAMAKYQYMANWLAARPDITMDVVLFPTPYIVRDFRDYYDPRSIFGDGLHMTEPSTDPTMQGAFGMSRAVEMMMTGVKSTRLAGGSDVSALIDLAWDKLQGAAGYACAGLGGALTITPYAPAGGDPLPSPAPLPGAPAGPVSAALPVTGDALFGGNSTIFVAIDAFGPLWTAGGGGVLTSAGQRLEEIWDGVYGDALRTGTYNLAILSIEDNFDTDGYPDPDSSQGLNSLQYLYWCALEAVDNGADRILIMQSPSHPDHEQDAQNSRELNYYRDWLETHSGIRSYIIPGARIVRNLLDAGLTPAEVYSDGGVHYTARVGQAFAWAIYAMNTKAMPAGSDTTDAIAHAAVLEALNNTYWSGFGGSEEADVITLADPLPSPPDRPSSGTAPSFATNPTITPATGDVGQVYTLGLGTYAGDPAPTATWTLTHSVDGDVTGDVVAGEYDSTGASDGTLTLSVSLSNSSGTAGPVTATATVNEAVTPIASRVFWTAADGYTGPALSGTQPTITGDIMAFDGTGLVNDGGFALTGGMYLCVAMRWGTVPAADRAVIFANTNPSDVFAEPYAALEANSFLYSSTYWNGSNSNQGGGSPDTDWVIIEAWQIGSEVGMNIDGGTDQTVAAFEAIQATDSLSLFATTEAVDVVYLDIRDTMPDGPTRSSLRAEASALIASVTP